IGLGPARRLILSGELIQPAEALRLGLIDYLVPATRFERGLEQVIQTFLAAPRTAVVASKRLMQRAFDADFETIYQESLPLVAACLADPDVQVAGDLWRRRRERKLQ